MENKDQFTHQGNSGGLATTVLGVDVEITKPNNPRYHYIEDKELEAIVKDCLISIEKSLCIGSVGYIFGQLEKIYLFFTKNDLSTFDKIIFLTVGIALATAIITGIQWYNGENKLDKILKEIRARKVINLTSIENVQQNQESNEAKTI